MENLTDAQKPHVFAIRELEQLLAENELTVRELQDEVTRMEKELSRQENLSSTASNSTSG